MDFQLMDYIVYGLQLLMDFQLMEFKLMGYMLMDLTEWFCTAKKGTQNIKRGPKSPKRSSVVLKPAPPTGTGSFACASGPCCVVGAVLPPS